MNTTIEKDFLKQLEKTSFQFIWGKRDKIRRAINMCQPSCLFNTSDVLVTDAP